MIPQEIAELFEWLTKKPINTKRVILIVVCVIGAIVISAAVAIFNGFFAQVGREHAENISKTKSKLPNNQIIETGISNLEKADVSSIKQNLPIDNPMIPPVWHDPTLGIEFVKAGDDNYWIGKDEITISQFSRYRGTGFTNVDQDQSPDCINIDSFKYKRNIENDSHSDTCISWKEARDFAAWLTERDKSGTFSIPTKREWQRSCEKGLINSSTLEWSADKLFSNASDDLTYLVVGRKSNQSSINCNFPDSGYAALERKSDVGFRLVWRPN